MDHFGVATDQRASNGTEVQKILWIAERLTENEVTNAVTISQILY